MQDKLSETAVQPKPRLPEPAGIFPDRWSVIHEMRADLIDLSNFIRDQRKEQDKTREELKKLVEQEPDPQDLRDLMVSIAVTDRELRQLGTRARATLLLYGYLRRKTYLKVEARTRATKDEMLGVLHNLPADGILSTQFGAHRRLDPKVIEALFAWIQAKDKTADEVRADEQAHMMNKA